MFTTTSSSSLSRVRTKASSSISLSRMVKLARRAAARGKPSSPPCCSVSSLSSLSCSASDSIRSAEGRLRLFASIVMEAPQPAGIAPSITLRPYQKQSLAFMLAVENSTDPSLVGQRPAERNDVHLMRDAVRGTAMSRAERQAGAYKVEIKNGPAPPTRAVRGGWLCDEVGMGDAAWSEAPRGGPRRLSAPDPRRGRLRPTVLQPWSLSDREPTLRCV